MVMWLWIGGLIMALGIAARARARAQARRARARDRRRARRRRATPRAAGRGAHVSAAPHALDRARRRASCWSRSASCSRCSTGRSRRCRGSCRSTSRRRASTSTTLDGKPITLGALAGKTYVVNFFNSWCIPCQQEAPALQGVLRRAQERARLRDGRHRPRRRRRAPIRGYVAANDDHVAGRVRSERQRRARLRHDRSTRDVRDLADGVAVCGALGP